MANKNRNRDSQQGRQSDIGNQQRTTQTGGQRGIKEMKSIIAAAIRKDKQEITAVTGNQVSNF